ncbi:MAG: NAD(P)/FAD-dependent oxidoreductase [Isosphaeraceae bacterium]
MSTSSHHVVVIGGGVIGAACAYYLSRSGWQVTIIDRAGFGSGSSHGNCGFICPSHVLPLAEPGMVGEGLRSLLQKNAPLAIKPRMNLALWSWLLHFALRCNHKDMMHAARGIQPLLESSLPLYQELIDAEHLDCEWQRQGLLFVYRDQRQMDAYAPTDRLLSEHFHCPARRFDGAAVVELEPALKPGLAGGYLYEDDAHLRPDRLMQALRQVLESSGVVVREHCGLRRFRRQTNRAVAADTTQESLTADAFVVATGAWTPTLADQLGCKVPIQPGKGYSLTMPRPSACPVHPIIFPETRVAVTPFQSAYRLGSTMEFSGYDTSLNPARLQLLRDGAAPYLKEPDCEPIEETWYGWRPMTWDSLPIIDRSPIMDNVLIAAGHNMLGMSMAPATGKLVAQLLADEPPFLDVKPYRVSRF